MPNRTPSPWLIAAALALILGVCESPNAIAADAATGPVINGPLDPAKVKWARLPNARDMAAVYPAPAYDDHVTGVMRIGCHVKTDGRLTGCVVISESPPGYGFGAAALSLAPAFRLKPANYGPDATIELAIRLTLDG